MNREAVASCDKKLRTVNKLVYVLETRPPRASALEFFSRPVRIQRLMFIFQL